MPEVTLILIRCVVSYLILLLFTRLLGKKQISQLTFFDYVVGITIGSIAANISVNQGVKILNGLEGLLIWTILPILFGIVALKSRVFNKIADGEPTILIENGKVLEKNLKKTRLTLGELMLNLRNKNAFKLTDVEFAVLETNGKVSVMKKADVQPVTPKLLNMQVEESHKPQMVIQDGTLMDKNLKDYGFTTDWLLTQIEKKGATDISDVFAAQVDSKGNVYVDLYDDQLKPPKLYPRQTAKAHLESVIADLETFILETNNKTAKQLYQQHAKQLKQLLTQCKPYLKD